MKRLLLCLFPAASQSPDILRRRRRRLIYRPDSGPIHRYAAGPVNSDPMQQSLKLNANAEEDLSRTWDRLSPNARPRIRLFEVRFPALALVISCFQRRLKTDTKASSPN